MSDEIWQPVPEYEGLYEVSSQGRVRSIDRYVKGKHGNLRLARGRLIAQTLLHGYPTVRIYKDNVGQTVGVHRLLCLAFYGIPPAGYQACHNDGDRAHNTLDNLRWDSVSENHRDSVRHGTHHNAKKTRCPRGHLLSSDNLVPSALPRRCCLECSRIRGRGEPLHLTQM